MSLTVEIENAALEWVDVTGLLEELADGTEVEGQVIPEITLAFHKLPADPDLTNPSLNRARARIRVTEGDLQTYYLMERPQGSVVRSLDSKSLYGRAWAGVLDNLRPVSFEWTEDTLTSEICAQIAHQDVENQSGITVGIVWQATLNQTIPGGRYSVSAADRRAVIAEVAEACVALVRTSLDGLSLEIYDAPDPDRAGAIAGRFVEGIAPLNYELRRVEQIANAVRVEGEVLDYIRASLPTVSVQVLPGAIEADGEQQAIARARVFDSGGRPVQHTAVVDEAITAGSYTEIPVSGCFAVQGVWLNSGTQDSPVKGDRIEPTAIAADAITVPDNGTQLFIVSYTRAETVSWSSSDVMDAIDGEARTTTAALAVSTAHPIGRVRGVFRATDTNRTGTNYFTGGSYTAGGTAITLGISPGQAGTAVIIDYDEYAGTALVNISPASSLCDVDGWAETTVGAGSTVGMVDIVASALGQEGSAALSLTGDAVGSLTVTAEPAVIRSQQSGTIVQQYTDETAPIQITTEQGYAEYYVELENRIKSVSAARLLGEPLNVARWENRPESHRVYLRPAAGGSFDEGTMISVDYRGYEEVSEADHTSTITATVLTRADEPVADGTEVAFKLSGAAGGAALNAELATTSGGDAVVTLTAGRAAEFYIIVTAGSHRARVAITVSDDPVEQNPSTTIGGVSTGVGDGTEEDAEDSDDDGDDDDDGNVSAGGGNCRTIVKDWTDGDGKVWGIRRAMGCDGPIRFARVIMEVGFCWPADADGYFTCMAPRPGTYRARIVESPLESEITLSGSDGTDEWSYEVCDG